MTAKVIRETGKFARCDLGMENVSGWNEGGDGPMTNPKSDRPITDFSGLRRNFR